MDSRVIAAMRLGCLTGLTEDDVTMLQIETSGLRTEGALPVQKVGADVLQYISQCSRTFEKEMEKLMGHSAGLIQQYKIQECQSYFPRLSTQSQCYAMPIVNVTTALAASKRIDGMEHLYMPDNFFKHAIKNRLFESDRSIFTVPHPLSPVRLAKLDAEYAEDINFDDPHNHGDPYKFIDQITKAPCSKVKAYLAGLTYATHTVRIMKRTADFDLWFLGQLREKR